MSNPIQPNPLIHVGEFKPYQTPAPAPAPKPPYTDAEVRALVDAAREIDRLLGPFSTMWPDHPLEKLRAALKPWEDT